ncbi:MAG: hypothetical protein HRU09_17010 [Oligoflexales bacterium]|nr:hypothetical protein [Oligoflexales bacterium]
MKLLITCFSAILLLACGKNSGFFSSSVGQTQIQKESEGALDESLYEGDSRSDLDANAGNEDKANHSETEGNPQPPVIPSGQENEEAEGDEQEPNDTVIAPVSITGAHLQACTVTSQNVVTCEFTLPISESEYASITVLGAGGVVVPFEELEFSMQDSEGRVIEIVVPDSYVVESISHEVVSRSECEDIAGDWTFVAGDSDYNNLSSTELYRQLHIPV